MPILNYTTTIQTIKTVGEIQEILARAGASSINIDFDKEHHPVSLTFVIQVKGYPVNFRLPSRWVGIYAIIAKDYNVPRKLRTEDQARRVAWRILKDWTQAQIALIEAGCAELPEVFLPYAVGPTGETLYQQFDKLEVFLLGSGE